MYICLCRGLKARDVRQAVADGYTTREMLIARMGWDSPACCGRCARNASGHLLVALDELRPPVAEAAG